MRRAIIIIILGAAATIFLVDAADEERLDRDYFVSNHHSQWHRTIHQQKREGSRKDGRTLYIDDFGAIPDSALRDWYSSEPLLFPEPFQLFEDPSTKPSSDSRKREQQHRVKLGEIATINRDAFNKALNQALAGDTVALKDGETYSFTGGILGEDLDSITIDFAGTANFIHNLDIWPIVTTHESKQMYVPAIDIVTSKNVTLTSSSQNRAQVAWDKKTNEVNMVGNNTGGILNGNGKPWWNDCIIGILPDGGDSRPRLVHVQSSADIVVEYLTLVNSAFWTLTVEAVGSEIRYVNVLVDRDFKANLMNFHNPIIADPSTSSSLLVASESRRRKLRAHDREDVGFHFPTGLPDWVDRHIHQPMDLNTDGIDVRGRNIWVHDCIVTNDDDSVAVKPTLHGRNTYYLNHTFHVPCTEHVLLENLILTGFGSSIGSVTPSFSHNCVDHITFRNISMPATGKGIYIKSNASPCKKGESAQLTNILYENVRIIEPAWWAIWIGPQAQHQPNTELGDKCALTYPLDNSKCPTQGCATFANITLRNIQITNPWLSPGVILGNATNPIHNLTFDHVTVTETNPMDIYKGRFPFHHLHFPYRGKFQCKHTNGKAIASDPVPDCFEQA